MAEESLFRRLTKLFRSGPTVKRKVRNYTQQDRSASSAVDLFKKHHSDVYNSTLSAYGTFDRMARYSDFSEMESTPEIASALDIYADEMTTYSSLQPMLRIKCPNEEIKSILHYLYHNVLNIEYHFKSSNRKN